MKKTFLGMIFYMIGSVILILAMIGIFFLFLMVAIVNPDPLGWVLVAAGVGGIVLFFTLLGYLFIQWVTVDEEKICARNLFGKLREITWKDVREVRIEKVMYDPRLKPIGWLIFIEEKDPYRPYAGGAMGKRSCIKIRYTPKNEEFLKQCHPEVKIVDHINFK